MLLCFLFIAAATFVGEKNGSANACQKTQAKNQTPQRSKDCKRCVAGRPVIFTYHHGIHHAQNGRHQGAA